MRNFKSRILGLSAGVAVMLGGSLAAFADDSEIYLGPSNSTRLPNIMFIFDTSGSMGTQVTTTTPYDAGQSYAGTGSCSGLGSKVFFVSGNQQGTPPGCNSGNSFDFSKLKCAVARTPMSSAGSGIYQDALIRWGGNNANKQWNKSLTVANGTDVECLADNGIDGDLAAGLAYPKTGTVNSTNGVWSATSGQSYWVAGARTVYTLYSGKYVAWYNQFRTTVLGTRMSIMQQAATGMLDSLTGVNVGLMRYSDNGGAGDLLARGGMVAYPVSPVEANRTNLQAIINGYSPGGYTPLSETLYESYLYYSGNPVYFGSFSSPSLSVASSRDPSNLANYKSPADQSCKNYVVYLTDGLPTADSEANTLINGLPSFSSLGGSCLAPGSGPDTNWPNSGLCLGAMAQYMFKGDLRPSAGQQNVRSFFIGLGSDFVDSSTNQLNAAYTYLSSAASRGGGEAFQANDLSDLTQVLTKITAGILDDTATLTAPTVAVNAFNQTKSLSDLYVSLFQPSASWHWPGNIKKYKLLNGVISDVNDVAAVNPISGFFKDTSQSLWAASADGKKVDVGGAANRLPDPGTGAGSRNVYTYLGGSNVTAGVSNAVTLSGGNTNYQVVAGNALLTDALLGTTLTTDPLKGKLIAWARGADVNDENSNSSTTDARHEMGDPLHSQPAVVIYGGSPAAQNLGDAVIYVATNDGYLHAFNVTDGIERWSFIPQELVPNLVNVYNDSSVSAKQYALDGDVTVLKFDVNGDGVIDPAGGDKVLLYVGQGRGGSHYYALDVTNKDSPKFLWNIGPTELPGIGQAWATPVIARVTVGTGTGQNNQRFVLIISGGYDPAEDGASINGNYVPADTAGNRLFMVDALYGNLLWSGGPTGAATSQQFGTRMDHSIPAAPSVIDTNNDEYADRIYAGDMAGQLWRFDIANGNAANNLMAGGVLASLGAHDDGTPLTVNARRFYSTPDPAQVTLPNVTPFMNIAIASGYRGHPLNTTIQDRLYSFRDYSPFASMTQAQYAAVIVAHDSNMTDITGQVSPVVANGSAGWKMLLNQNGGWVGEKSLSASQTVSGAIYYTSYAPTASAGADPCTLSPGTARLYVVNVLNGTAAVDLNHNGTVDASDLQMVVPATGILPQLTVLFRVDANGGSGGPGGPGGPPGGGGSNVCLIGTVTVPCPPFNDKIKTYWREGSAN